MDINSNKSVFVSCILLLVSLEITGFPLDTFSDRSYPSVATTHVRVTDPRASAGGVGEETLEKPTAKIVVRVTRRSGRYWEPWELNTKICPPSLCASNGEGGRKRPTGTGDSIFYNGDIVLDKYSEKIIFGNTLRYRYRRATSRTSRLWKDAIVPYIFGDEINPLAMKYIKKAMKKIESKTCIKFRRKKPVDNDYIRYISEPGCWSMVGRVGGEQKLSIGMGCERLGTAIHEISHALGFWHEQARPDRDKYIRVLEENISPSYLPDFAKANKSLVTSRGFPYDYESVMHYSRKAFTRLGDITIKVIGIGEKLKMSIGQREALSTIDIAQLRDMYHCNDKEDHNVTFCPKGWKKSGRSCYKFEDKMREQFAGAVRHCQSLNSRLLIIDSSREDRFIKKTVKKRFPKVSMWRTAARKMNGTFGWFVRENRTPIKMKYTKWKKGHPATFSSMALVYNKTINRVKWQGVWLGSAKQMPAYAYAFICERRAKRKCIPGKFKDGRDYRGKLDHTIDGYTCQKWSSQYPHSHKLLPYPFKTNKTRRDPDGLGDHNYCRNPEKERKSRPWCFTTKKKYSWQYCDVSVCAGNKNGQTNKPDIQSEEPTNRGGNKKGQNNKPEVPKLDKNNRGGNKKGQNNKPDTTKDGEKNRRQQSSNTNSDPQADSNSNDKQTNRNNNNKRTDRNNGHKHGHNKNKDKHGHRKNSNKTGNRKKDNKKDNKRNDNKRTDRKQSDKHTYRNKDNRPIDRKHNNKNKDNNKNNINNNRKNSFDKQTNNNRKNNNIDDSERTQSNHNNGRNNRVDTNVKVSNGHKHRHAKGRRRRASVL